MARKPLILDRYELLGTAGAGGFGTVRIAWDPRIQRKVAIKTIELSETDALRARLPGADAVDEPRVMPAGETAGRWHGVQPWNEYLAEQDAAENGADGQDDEHRPAEDAQPVTALAHLPGLDEARTAAMLSDSRIVTVFDFEVRGQTAYLIMEYVEGITLTRFLADYGDYLTLDMTAAVFDAVAGALSVAHKAGVLHLDIKPDNIIINADGQAKVTDFGLATLADASGAGTTGGGTIGYMPLEQMRRQPLDARTDEWSLASLTYEMLTGENPFRAQGLDAAEKAIENAELILPSLCWDDIDEQIDDVIFYALDPDPDQRYASIRDFAEEMDKFLGDADQGKAQLAEIVDAELNPGQPDDDEYDEEYDGFDAPDVPRMRRPHLFERMRAALAPRRRTEEGEDAPEDPDAPVQRPDAGPLQPRVPMAKRVPDGVKAFAARVFGAAASGFLTALSLVNVPILWVAFGSGAAYVIGAAVVVVALAGAAVPSVGALVSLLLLVVSLVSCGHPIVAVVLAVAAIAWWYFVGRQGFAAGNTLLALPPAGAVGASSAVPFVAGAALPFIPALATTALAALVACILAAAGSGSLVNWQAFAHWNFSQVDVSANVLQLVRTPSTWATVAGWLVASGVLAFTGRFKARWMRVAGIAVAVAAVLTGTLVFAGPSPELFITVIVVAAVLIAEV